ncbi:MAG: hypothetical protein ACON35_08395 [Candidatus Marinamargulisbacteria bacterium]
MIGRTATLKIASQQFIRKWKPIGIHFSNKKHIKLCENYYYEKKHSSGPGIYALDLDNKTNSLKLLMAHLNKKYAHLVIYNDHLPIESFSTHQRFADKSQFGQPTRYPMNYKNNDGRIFWINEVFFPLEFTTHIRLINTYTSAVNKHIFYKYNKRI